MKTEMVELLEPIGEYEPLEERYLYSSISSTFGAPAAVADVMWNHLRGPKDYPYGYTMRRFGVQ